MNTRFRFPAGTVTAGLAAALALLAACSSSTDPGGGGEVEITYSPTAAAVTLPVGGSLELRATVTGTTGAVITWTVGGVEAGSGPVYVHGATAVGTDTVAVAVQAGDRASGRSWLVTVEPDESLLPPVVSGVALGHGPVPAEVTVSWLRVTATRFPIVEYLVACRYDGPVDTDTWEGAILLGTFAHDPGVLLNRRTFGEADGMVPGAPAWFAVRARDDRGQLSPIDGVFAHTISYAWDLHVRVTDDAGLPLHNVILNHGTGDPVTTDAAGRAAIGPLRSVDAVAVATTSPHFDYAAAPVTVTGDTLRIVLLRQYALVHDPCGTPDYVDFLDYFRDITLTDGGGERGTILNKWDSYPLSVWIPPFTSTQLQWDLQALSAAAVPIWNDALGQDYLVAAADSLSADIVFAFRDLPDPYKGLTRVLLPGGDIGEFIPRKMELIVESVLDQIPGAQPVWVTEIALHELGHALGHYGHTCSVNRGNLMDAGGSTGSLADGPQNAINLDEVRLVRAFRHLPQGTAMEGYGAR
ncbi:MAG: hypothetical protein IH621_16260 [Krumholzibacteria bacterium]|nr:hypothetical protein [Candidatus Krumholzibacteria bacterium]